jgi:hypothetical protein
MFKVDDDKRPDYTIVIPWFAQDYFDFVEYAAFDQIFYYTLTCSYDIIPNPHIKVVVNKTSIVNHPLIRHSRTFKSKQKKEWLPK